MQTSTLSLIFKVVYGRSFPGFYMKCPSGIWVSFTCRWRKVEGEFCLVAEGWFWREAWGKMGDKDFFFFLLRQRPFWPGSLRMNTCSQSAERYRPVCARHASTRRFPSHPSTTAVIMHPQTDSKRLALTIHGHLAKASVLTVVATATASHTHMCGIRGQGSWVVLCGLNGALCVIIQTSSNPRLKTASSPRSLSLQQRKACGWNFSFST